MKFRRLSFVAVAITLAGCGDSATTLQPDSAPSFHAGEHDGKLSASVRAQLAQVRRATARYHNIDAAIADGYTIWSPNPFAANATCATSAQGKMGYHLINTDLRGSPASPATANAELDPMKPEMLLYEKRADGKLHLVGVEYLVFQQAWEALHGSEPPMLLGQTVPLSVHSFTPGGPEVPHYELHVWIWKPNPNGMFSHWNPNISC